MTDNDLGSLAENLQDLESLRKLLSALNFDFANKHANKSNWTTAQKEMIQDARIVAKKDDYHIFYIQTNSDSLRDWKGIASKIIKNHSSPCMVCSHNPSGFKWVFSSLSKEFSASFSETRHIPIDINPQSGVPKPFVEFLKKIKVTEPNTTAIIAMISDAFDEFAIKIHDELTVNVFEALKTLSEGIIMDKSNHLVLDEQILKEIREPVFILLYRIMFVLYAEDRAIFPDNKFYCDTFSLKWIKSEWILKQQHNLKEYDVYNRLKKLFRLIESGSEDLDYDPDKFYMRSYYGRLFDRKIHSKLDKWKIPNKNVLEAINLLTRTRDKEGNWFFLDYAALETRHLGSIYERLLEYHLTISGGKISDLPNPKERKATGSYYTPQYIVDYIVENTVGPLINDIESKTKKVDMCVDKILDLNILDPAMGSGHFLVGVVNYMAKRICKIEYGDDVTEESFIERKRDVARRCVYGVDLNPLAVDLAAVSLWLETLASDRPLSFLSAHLKAGNSLIGSSINDILDKQTTLVESPKGRARFKQTVRDFIMLETLEDDSAEAVRTKVTKYTKMKAKGTVYRDLKFLLNAKVAALFGVDVPPLADYATKIGENSLDFYVEGSAWQKAEKVACEHSFFHWDLEFPDVFYDRDGKSRENPGFDAVVGNPKYLNVSSNDILKKNPDSSILSNGILNVATLFIKKSIDLISRNSLLGFIIPKSFLTVESWKPIRKLVLDYNLIKVNDVGKQWLKVGLEQTIIIVVKNNKSTTTEILSKTRHIDYMPQNLFQTRGVILTCLDRKGFEIVQKIEKNATTLLNTIADMPRGISVESSKYSPNKKINMVQVLGGVNIERFRIKDGAKRKPNRFLKLRYSDIISKKEIFNKKRIVYQNVASSIPKIVATFVEAKTITDDTVNNLIINNFSSQYSYFDILGILNSDLITYYLRYAIINNSKLTIHLDKPYLGKIPIKNPNGSLAPMVSNLLRNIDTVDEHYIRKQMHKINDIVFNMYGLNKEESKIITNMISN